ncbi:unnamed protein product [Rhizoctonia solani]|uniref:Uncharacterized protein n=1 Tax=Rhizoctonia solani TaxID=456999 RepID=A0A8H3I1Z2_9AGAM|nr:unnamed protein product [Rhizoctonia solani]
MRSLSLLPAALLIHQTLAQVSTYSDSIFSPYIAQKYDRVGAAYKSASYPHVTAANGSWVWTGADWWTSGFLPGSFYLLEERKRLCPNNKNLASVDWLTYGRRWSDGLVRLQAGNGQGHDQGFLALPYLDELKINPTNASAITGVKNFATLLANRYSSIVGCTRSWNSAAPEFQVIMDNMMNLELLFKAAELTGNRTLIDMAISHANKTITNHIRPDGSSYHVVAYNENTGAVIRRYTAQGYADNSTWTRGTNSFNLMYVIIECPYFAGQAWGIYGFAKMFNLTTQPQYLDTARRMAKVFLTRLPSNGVPPYDFDAPASNRPADTSAATIAAEGLFILSAAEAYTNNATGQEYYKQQGVKLLVDNFNFAFKPTWDSILSNGTSNVPQNNKNTGLVYGDYYAIQAGNTMLKLGLASC